MRDLEVSSYVLAQGLKELTDLSSKEYEIPIGKLFEQPIKDPNAFEVQRFGRLIGITLKQPYSKPHKAASENTPLKSHRVWELLPVDFSLPNQQGTWQYKIIDCLRQEGGFNDVESFVLTAHHEAGFFYFLIRSCHKYICGNDDLQKKIKDSIDTVQNSGGIGQVITPKGIIGAGAMNLASYLIEAISWLTPAASPIIVGLIIVISSIGLDTFCSWSKSLPRQPYSDL